MAEALIEIRDLCKIYNPGEVEVRALDHVNLTINRGELVAIIGQSGSGKSTLMNQLGCLDVPTSGDYYLSGQNVAKLSDNELSEVPLIYRGIGKRERRQLAIASLEKVGLGHRLDHKPSQMSGGQQQRVAIARAIAAAPPLILADEPTGNLDSASSKEILGILKQLHASGRTVILITHDNEIAAQAKRIIHIRDGQIDSDINNEGGK